MPFFMMCGAGPGDAASTLLLRLSFSLALSSRHAIEFILIR
jgi:hypothetical protein